MLNIKPFEVTYPLTDRSLDRFISEPSLHLRHPTDLPPQSYHNITEHSVSMMKTKDPQKLPHHRWIRWQAQWTASPPSSNMMLHRPKCYTRKYSISEGQKISSMNLNISAQQPATPSTQDNGRKQTALLPKLPERRSHWFLANSENQFKNFLRDVFIQFRQEFAREDFKEVFKYKRNQLTYDPSNWTFAEFLKTLKSLVKQAFEDKASEFVETFPFGKLSIQIQHKFSTAGKADASVEEINVFIRRRFQYQPIFLTLWMFDAMGIYYYFPFISRRQTNEMHLLLVALTVNWAVT